MTENTIIGIEIGSLMSIIRTAVAQELQNSKPLYEGREPRNEMHLYTREQAMDFLQICSTTLWQITKDGLIQSRRIKSKVFYLKNDLESFILNQVA